MPVKIFRSRKTRRAWRLETERVIVQAGGIPAELNGGQVGRSLQIGFDLEAAGGGKTSIVVSASPDSFEDLAAKMAIVDPEATDRAFLSVRKKRGPS